MNRALAAQGPTPTDDDIEAMPTREGLSVIDTTGILTGNADIECEWSPPKPDNAFTLPIYPAPSDLPKR